MALPVPFGEVNEDDLLVGNRPLRRPLGTSDYRPFLSQVLEEMGWSFPRVAPLHITREAMKIAQQRADEAWLKSEEGNLRAHGRHFIDRTGPQCQLCAQRVGVRVVDRSGLYVGRCCATGMAAEQLDLIRVVPEDEE